MLRALPEQKSLVYFASGLRLNGVDNQAQLRATTNAAIRANVSIYPDRRARARGAGAARRRDAAVARRHRHVHRADRAERDDATSSGRRTRSTRWRRTPAARRCSTTTTCRSGSCRRRRRCRSYYIIGYYSTHTAHRRQVPSRQGLADRAASPASSRTARATSPTRSSRSSPPPTRSVSSRKR